MMAGYLRSEGIFVQRRKIRQFLNDIDPISVARRWTATKRRRRYNVPTPNSLWHMDAHYKLSRWGFIIHGCIDGYSRLIIYLSCTTSIQAEPVVRLFMRAYGEYGIPSRVRSDHGYENIFVALLMNLLRGMNRGSHITGKSVHNQRIERLWVDVYKEVVDAVYNELYELEDTNKLDPDNNVHRYCCQYVYLPLINMRLKSFMAGWNLHKLRTANRNTPRQIWLNGMLNNYNSSHTAITEVFDQQDDLLTRMTNSLQSYGINAVINPDIITEPSLFTAHVDISNETKLELEEICFLMYQQKRNIFYVCKVLLHGKILYKK